MKRSLLAGIAAVAALSTAAPASAGVFATTPEGRSPEGIVTIGNTTWVSTTPVVPQIAIGSGTASVIYGFDRDSGAATGSLTVGGERTLGAVQGIAGLTSDGAGGLIATDAQGRLLRFDTTTGTQTTFATLPDVPPCTPLRKTQCSAHPVDLAPLANEITRLPDGGYLVSDSFQALVWHVPPAGGAGSVLVTDRRFIGTAFGPNGIAVSPDGTTVLLAIMSDPTGQSVVYRFPLATPSSITTLGSYGAEGLDGFAWRPDGAFWATASNTNSVHRIDTQTGVVLRTLTDLSLASPAGIEVDESRGEILVANHDVTPAPHPGTVSRLTP